MNKEGFGIVEGLLLAVLVIGVGVFGWYVWSQNDSSSESVVENQNVSTSEEETANDEDWIEYQSDEFAFSLKYPSEWGVVSEDVTDRTDAPDGIAGGKYMKLEFSDYQEDYGQSVNIFSATADYFVYKGPFPMSYFLAKGWDELGERYTYNGGDKSSILNQSNFVESATISDFNDSILYVVEEESVIGSMSYSYSMNTPQGGVQIYTENGEKLDLLEQIARTLANE